MLHNLSNYYKSSAGSKLSTSTSIEKLSKRLKGLCTDNRIILGGTYTPRADVALIDVFIAMVFVLRNLRDLILVILKIRTRFHKGKA